MEDGDGAGTESSSTEIESLPLEERIRARIAKIRALQAEIAEHMAKLENERDFGSKETGTRRAEIAATQEPSTEP
jgi:hypothetical protein